MDPRVWVVTGCSSGIGRATVECILHNTSDIVVATVRKEGTLSHLTAEFGARIYEFVLDVTDSTGRDTLAAFVSERFGHLDVLVNNAGIATMGSALDLPETELRRVFETNFFAVVALSQWAGKVMVGQKKGMIIQISSTAGLIGYPANGAYGASKFALEGFTESLHREVSGFGLRVHVLELGNCETSFFGHNYRAVSSRFSTEEVSQALEFFDSRRRSEESVGLSPAEVAEGILALANSPEAPFRLMLGAEARGVALTKIGKLSADHDWSLEFHADR